MSLRTKWVEIFGHSYDISVLLSFTGHKQCIFDMKYFNFYFKFFFHALHLHEASYFKFKKEKEKKKRDYFEHGGGQFWTCLVKLDDLERDVRASLT